MRLTKTVSAVGINGAGAAAFVVGVFADGKIDTADLRAFGLIVFVSSLVWGLMSRGRRDEDAVYEAGREAGYDAGFIDGRRIARPVVVSIDGGRRMAASDS